MLKKFFQKFGLDIRRYRIEQNPSLRLKKIFEDNHIDLVLDIGANIGQYRDMLRDLRYHGKIISFEPMSKEYDVLKNRATNDSNWVIAPKTALGDVTCQTIINLTKNSASSSLLNMKPLHVDAAPNSFYVGCELCDVNTLDNIGFQYITQSNTVFMKIDTQGYEYQVIKGALNFINEIQFIQLELSLVELYEGQVLFTEMINFMDSLSFRIISIDPAFVNPKTGQVLQVDVIFFKK